MKLELHTAGESHGKAILGILEGLPSGLSVDKSKINRELARRQGGYGRGGRMDIEEDLADITSGLIQSETIGTPVGIRIVNEDWQNWEEVMAPFGDQTDDRAVTVPRPGHADLSGIQKRGFQNCRKVLERSSARETALRVAGAAFCKQLLEEFAIEIQSRVTRIGKVKDNSSAEYRKWEELASENSVRVLDSSIAKEMEREIDEAGERGDTLGGLFEVVATAVPPGLGDYAVSSDKLDAILSAKFMSIPGIKSVEIGLGKDVAALPGSEVHDEIFYEKGRGTYRKTNNAGGLEGGVTNGEPVRVTAAMKPIPTLQTPLRSVDLTTLEPAEASKERSDVCAVPSASIVGEAEMALALAGAFIEKFGGDSMSELTANYRHFMDNLRGHSDRGERSE